MERSFGTRLTDVVETEEQVDEFLEGHELREKHRKPRKKDLGKWRSLITITEQNISEATLLVQGVVEKYGTANEGELVRAIIPAWQAIAEKLRVDWSHANEIPPRIWEEIVAATFERDGYDEVTLTPRSGDYGRDIIAVRRGICCVRIIGSVKAFKPGHLVKHDDVRALAGILLTDHRASKGIVTTTSDFAPNIATDPYLSPLMPYRLELMNGKRLQKWLADLTK